MQCEVFGTKGENEAPEAWTVIHLPEMTEFVNHDRAHEGFAFGHDAPVVRDPARGERAAPERSRAPPNHAPVCGPQIRLFHDFLVNGPDVGLEIRAQKPPVGLLHFGFRRVGRDAQMKNPVLNVRRARSEPNGTFPSAPAKRFPFSVVPAGKQAGIAHKERLPVDEPQRIGQERPEA